MSDDYLPPLPVEPATIEQTAWVLQRIDDHIRNGCGSFRKLIYREMGYGPEAYTPLLLAGGMNLTNALVDWHDGGGETDLLWATQWAEALIVIASAFQYDRRTYGPLGPGTRCEWCGCYMTSGCPEACPGHMARAALFGPPYSERTAG